MRATTTRKTPSSAARSSPATDPDMNDTGSPEEYWNSDTGVPLTRWLRWLEDNDKFYDANPGMCQLFEYGTMTIKSRTVFENEAHRQWTTDNADKVWTFRDPSPAFAFARTSEDTAGTSVRPPIATPRPARTEASSEGEAADKECLE